MNGFLLDTHTLLWYLRGDSLLPLNLRSMIERGPSFFSIASVWEMSIKAGKGTLPLFVPLHELVNVATELNGFRLFRIELSHVLAVQHLPPHHGDPFDRLLIAQAQIEGLTLVSRDAAFDDYRLARVW